tara:strand:+ start:724 stop:1599 length:876 start_codon:yes stop_codon:yes gene_type:complete
MAATDNDLSRERFGFTVFLSACFHAIVILGVGFTYLEEINSESAIEITLAQYRSDIAPDDADFLAQENQAGSGTLDEKAAPSTPFESDFNDDDIEEVQPIPQIPDRENDAEVQDAAVVTSASNEEQTRQLIEQNVPEQDATQSVQSSSDELSLSIASLRAQLDLQRQAYAKRPRKYTISSASTKKNQDALYLDNWRKRIEAIGNLNYPDAARRQQLYGNLRLLVSILPDGVVEEIRILQSSGHSILDQAALGIVQLAAPFQPFPDELRETVDILEIIRTWRFHERTGLTTY